ncbi:NAK protein kinase [Thecamonas trahens ATCC 50062]|uniref:non-specific serine/threonine protein kinase n=1 Tax=Thecamonas trahens ATCC 50062 TaxID=461836 RepID=A0A0L0DNL7_THETB|nr:NAK protein kinase [Thecamonas trahens ATCC 50062]KNC53013.1 NAK protein kinase [Thecamonas trahens ATCC 50062]|eukprot:XP_013754899.1 NAK protein kinase [Thecamonas trahens ATCC 50062]
MGAILSLFRRSRPRERVVLASGREWRVGKVLARGGYSAVHAGTDATGEEQVAIKVISLVEGGTTEADVEGEVAAHRLVDHESLAPLIDAGRHPRALNQYLMVFPRYAASLADYVQKHADGNAEQLPQSLQRQLAAADLAALFLPVVRGVAALHAAGAVHRDIKPANIMLDADASAHLGWRPVLIDFGSVRPVAVDIPDRAVALEEQDRAAAHSTAHFRAPELFDVETGSVLGPAVDVFALGASLYSVAFIALAFDGTYTAALARLPVPDNVPADANQLLAICQDACAADVAARISLDELEARLVAVIDGSGSGGGV